MKNVLRFYHLSFIALVCALWVACNPPVKPSPEMENYDISDLQDGWQKAELLNIDKQTIEEGFFHRGQKAGTWVKYDEKGEQPVEIMSYIDGQAHGLNLKFNEQGQISQRAYYKDNQLDGLYQQFAYGKLKMEAHYSEGHLDGMVTKYINYSNKKLTEAEYKNGKLDGVFRHFDDEGNVTLEYIYKDGEKVSGEIK